MSVTKQNHPDCFSFFGNSPASHSYDTIAFHTNINTHKYSKRYSSIPISGNYFLKKIKDFFYISKVGTII